MQWSSGESSRGRRGPRRGDRHGLNPQLELLHHKVVTDLQEGGARSLTGDPRTEVSVAVVEPAEDVEDQDTVLHELAKFAKRVRHALHLAAEERSPWTKVLKLAFRRRARASAFPRNWPSSARMWSVAEEVVEVHEDRPHDPRKDDVVES